MDACNFVPGHVILVHDDPSFIEEAAAALRTAGHDVATFIEPMEALNALEKSREDRHATGELERLPAPLFGVLPHLPFARYGAYETHSLAPGLATAFS